MVFINSSAICMSDANNIAYLLVVLEEAKQARSKYRTARLLKLKYSLDPTSRMCSVESANG